MKFEIEITEDEIKSAIERKFRTAIADVSNNWKSDDYIKEQVRKHWHDAADKLVTELLSDSAILRQRVIDRIEAKLKGQLTAAMRQNEIK